MEHTQLGRFVVTDRDGIKNPVLTARVGNNNDLFPDVLDLYVPDGSTILDVTYGKGIFWKDVNIDARSYKLFTNDCEYGLGEYSYDCRELPKPWEDAFDTVIFDPPYLYVGGWKTMRNFGAANSKLYRNQERAEKISGVKQVDLLYYNSMKEAYRVLKHKGILIIKCMDQVQSGKQVWAHMTYKEYAEILGFRSEDLFVLVRKSKPLMRHKKQIHARKNHSYFLVFKAWKK